MIVSIDRLRELAEAPCDDYHVLAEAVQHLAIAILERSGVELQTSAATGHPPPKRFSGKPIGDKIPHPCADCGADVVTFYSKAKNRPYPCDVEIGEYQGRRTALTAANWFHKCPNKEKRS